METENFCKFIDGLVEGAYQKGLFQKEAVQGVLNIAEAMKSKLQQGDVLAKENEDLKTSYQALEVTNENLRNRFDSLGIDLEEIKKPTDANEIEIEENSIEEVSNHVPKKNGKSKLSDVPT